MFSRASWIGWLSDREAARQFDWRYYFVRYDANARGAPPGRYVGSDGRLGYSVCHAEQAANETATIATRYLHAIWRAKRCRNRNVRGQCLYWLRNGTRGGMPLKKSTIRACRLCRMGFRPTRPSVCRRCAGVRTHPSPGAEILARWTGIPASSAQVKVDGQMVDTEDRNPDWGGIAPGFLWQRTFEAARRHL